ncbi:hypothetical protein D3C80_1748260 [compost metagenome]
MSIDMWLDSLTRQVLIDCQLIRHKQLTVIGNFLRQLKCPFRQLFNWLQWINTPRVIIKLKTIVFHLPALQVIIVRDLVSYAIQEMSFLLFCDEILDENEAWNL